jgi:hypothetical protein
MTDDHAANGPPPIEVRPHVGPPLMFFFKDRIDDAEAAYSLTRLIEDRLTTGAPLMFTGVAPDSVAVLQLVDGRWIPAWPVAPGDGAVPRPGACEAGPLRGDPIR